MAREVNAEMHQKFQISQIRDIRRDILRFKSITYNYGITEIPLR